MNQYTIEIGNLGASNATEKEAVCRAWGYAALAAVTLEHTPQSVQALDFSETHTKFVTPFRVPGAVGITQTGVDLAAGKAFAWLPVADSTMTQELNNMERAIVNQGDFIVALCPAGVSVANQLVNASTFQLPAGFTLQVGVASQTAEQGVYETPFSTADAFINFGSLTNVQGLVTNGVPLPRPASASIPVAGGVNKADVLRNRASN